MATTQNLLHLLVVIILTGHFGVITARIGNSMYPLLQTVKNSMANCNFNQIYQVGDSLSDTGNIEFESPPPEVFCPFGRPPYGENFYENATGRCSDGMLMIDYIALASGLPLLNPYKKSDSDFRHGVNFAVVGATALPVEVLADLNITAPLMTSSSLTVQLGWMSEYFNSICRTNRDCAVLHRNSLFMVGEVGGNDIFYALQNGIPIDEVRSIVPTIVQTVQDAAQRVIHMGATRIVVSGNFPIGCLPSMLTILQTKNSSAYDENKCLKEVNNLAIYENELIQLAIEELKQRNPNVTIVYGDYYNALQWLFRNAESFGFDVESIHKPCCGTGGDYNFDFATFCGDYEVPVCADPSRFISWDGVHFTQNAYKFLANRIMEDILPQLKCSHASKRSLV
jgi:phospholipase/lecithinase/hemolysin